MPERRPTATDTRTTTRPPISIDANEEDAVAAGFARFTAPVVRRRHDPARTLESWVWSRPAREWACWSLFVLFTASPAWVSSTRPGVRIRGRWRGCKRLVGTKRDQVTAGLTVAASETGASLLGAGTFILDRAAALAEFENELQILLASLLEITETLRTMRGAPATRRRRMQTR